MNAKDLKSTMVQVMAWCRMASPGDNELNLSTVLIWWRHFSKTKMSHCLSNECLSNGILFLGALLLAVVLCLALDLLTCNWAKWPFWPNCPLFRPVLDSFGRKKLDKTGFIQFFPFCLEETGFGRKKPNPGCTHTDLGSQGYFSVYHRSCFACRNWKVQSKFHSQKIYMGNICSTWHMYPCVKK